MHQPAEGIKILLHLFRIDDELVDHRSQTVQGKIKGNGRIGAEDPLNR